MAISQADPSILSETKSGFVVSGGDGSIFTGTPKLVQRVIVELLTEQGSMRFNPKVGSPFVSGIKSGQLYSEYDIKALFLVSADTVKTNLKALETDSTPINERLSSISLSRMTVLPGRVIMTITIKDMAGTSYNIATLAGVSI